MKTKPRYGVIVNYATVKKQHKANMDLLTRYQNEWHDGLYYWEYGKYKIVTEKLYGFYDAESLNCYYEKRPREKHFGESAKVVYKSYLIDPSIKKFKSSGATGTIVNGHYDLPLRQSIKIAAIKTRTHSLRGNWKKRALEKLLSS